METHSSVLAWRIPGTGEPGGLPSMGSHRVGHDWSDLACIWVNVASVFMWASYGRIYFCEWMCKCVFGSMSTCKWMCKNVLICVYMHIWGNVCEHVTYMNSLVCEWYCNHVLVSKYMREHILWVSFSIHVKYARACEWIHGHYLPLRELICGYIWLCEWICTEVYAWVYNIGG